ncbi:MAG TPA: hypothetical protein VLG76_01830 [Rhabdochlamydiaceae bacterium]|nr:hypothetical protein [Rhabdochlamydiaceae bacterium]
MVEKITSQAPIFHPAESEFTRQAPVQTNPSSSSLESLGDQKGIILIVLSKIYAFLCAIFNTFFGTPKPIYPTTSPLATPPLENQSTSIAIETPKNNGYAALEPSNEEKEKIYFVFHALANRSFWYLAFSEEIKTTGSEIDHVHPYKLLKELLTTELKNDLIKMRRAAWPRAVWNKFIENLTRSFDRMTSESLLSYLPDFAKELRHELSPLEPLIKKRDWEGLVIQLLENQSIKS